MSKLPIYNFRGMEKCSPNVSTAWQNLRSELYKKFWVVSKVWGKIIKTRNYEWTWANVNAWRACVVWPGWVVTICDNGRDNCGWCGLELVTKLAAAQHTQLWQSTGPFMLPHHVTVSTRNYFFWILLCWILNNLHLSHELLSQYIKIANKRLLFTEDSYVLFDTLIH